MKPEPLSDYNRKVAGWLMSHGIEFEITQLGAEYGFAEETGPGPRFWHDTYTATFKRSDGRSLVVPKFYQSAARSESAIRESKCTKKTCGVQYGERSTHIPRCRVGEGEIPSASTILSTMPLHDPGLFSDFCSDFGYDEDSRKAERTYFAVQDEWKRVRSFFTWEELEELREIAS